jgi:hypothetical protein
MGGAMMVPVGRLVILRTTRKDELVRALSYLTIPALLGPVIGPPLGGLSPLISIGAGFSSSIFPSACWAWCWLDVISKICEMKMCRHWTRPAFIDGSGLSLC